MMDVQVIGADRVARDLALAAARLAGETSQVVRRHGVMLVQRIRAHASGRPGPNVITGQYRASWQSQTTGTATRVWTDAPQAMRLENGFVGADSLGRLYNQPPFPHIGPAVDEVEPQFEAALALVVAKVLQL